MRFNKQTEEAAQRFFNLLAPNEHWHYTDHKAKRLLLGAFHLYAKDWEGSRRWDIRRWEWPYIALRGETTFDGDEPWTVLFRRALELCRK